MAIVLVLSGITAAFAAPPKVNFLFPAGCQRGQAVSVTASGDFSSWPVQIWSSGPGITATAEKDKGKLKIEVAPDVVPGVYWLRMHDGEGASQLRPFVVGTLSEVLEEETNDLPGKPQTIEPRVVVNGKLAKSGDVDGYRVDLKAGQTLVAAVQANSVLGSPMDCVLQVCELVQRPTSSIGGSPSEVEAYVADQNHDGVGLDPQLIFTAQADGSYLVRLFAFPSDPNSSIQFAGGDAFVYRLTLTTGGYANHALPLAVSREAAEIKLAGWNLSDPSTIQVAAATALAEGSLEAPDETSTVAFHPEVAGSVELQRVEHASLVAAEPNDPAQPQQTPLPAAISGCFEADADVDAFAFTLTKDQKLKIEVAARALGFPTDAVIAVLDEAGKTLAEADDNGRSQRDPELAFTAPADGRYRVVIRDLHGRGGVRLTYLLTVAPVRPDFSLSLAADSFTLEGDKPLEIPVTVNARDGFKEPIEIRAVGLPVGVTAEAITFTPSGDSPASGGRSGRRGRRGGNEPSSTGPTAKLVLKGDVAALTVGGTAIRIEGRSSGEMGVVRSARFPLNLPLTSSHWATWLTVKK